MPSQNSTFTAAWWLLTCNCVLCHHCFLTGYLRQLSQFHDKHSYWQCRASMEHSHYDVVSEPQTFFLQLGYFQLNATFSSSTLLATDCASGTDTPCRVRIHEPPGKHPYPTVGSVSSYYTKRVRAVWASSAKDRSGPIHLSSQSRRHQLQCRPVRSV